VVTLDIAAPAEEVDTATPPSPRPVHILIVDDDRAKRAALRAALVPLNFAIIEADSGVAALRSLMSQNVAAILLDVFMPIMDGFETAALIRQRRQSEMTPIIFITASKSDEIADMDRFAQGAVDFIFAPVDPGELRAKVQVFANLYLNADLLAAQARALQISADHLRMVTDVAPIGIFQTDAQRRYVYTNPRWSEITGIHPSAAVGRPLDSVIASELRPDLMDRLDDPNNRGAELSCRFEIPGPGSTRRVAILTVAPIPDDNGGVAGLIGTVADVTAEAEAEAAMSEAHDAATSASQLKSDFLANMSHEIRTPMNGVIGMADLLLETDLDARQHDYAQTVRNSGEALLIIINDILDFSKVEAGMVEIEDTEMSIRSIVDDVADLLAAPALAKGIELVSVIDNSLPRVVRGDPGRLRQVLMNLIGNAIKFTDAGEVVIRVAGDMAKSPEIMVRFEVRDSGEGIAPDKMGTIFQPFVQADTSTSRRHGGTGLGLAISAQLVTLMGGEYGVDSQLSSGSTFWFTINVLDMRTAGRGDTRSPLIHLSGLRALVVEDNKSQRTALSEQLTEWGMDVTAVGAGLPALEVLRDAVALGAPFSVGLIDRSMEGMSGLDLGLRISADPTLTIPLVLMIGIGQDHGLDADSAFRTLLTKPVHLDTLLDSLRIALASDCPDTGPLHTGRSAHPSRARPPTRRLLLVEDNLINQKVALAMLAGSTYAVDAVFDGEGAVGSCALGRYDVILMDCQMPGMNGFEATAAIRAQEGNQRHTPIIALTAGARAEDRDRCLSGGMDGYLAKPVNKIQLLELLSSFTERHPPAPAADGSVTDLLPAIVHPVYPGRAAPFDTAPVHTVLVDPPDLPVLDEDILGQLTQLGNVAGEDLVGKLAALFLEDADLHISIMSEALTTSDVVALSRSAHMLSGSSANLGATELARLCAVYGSETGPDLPEGSEWFLPAVESELARVRTALTARASVR
jgi:PAS domain S-box-containing protein